MQEEIIVYAVPDRVLNQFNDPDGYLVFDDTKRTISNAYNEVTLTDTEYNGIISHLLSNEYF